MRQRFLSVALAGLAALFIVNQGQAAVGFDPLLKYLPPNANTLFLIDGAKLMDSEMAQQRQWAAQRKLQASDHAVVVPPGANRWIAGAYMDPVSFDIKRVGLVVELKHELPSMDTIAKAEGGHTDTIGDFSAAWSPRNLFVLGLDKQIAGVQMPSDRQALIRWARNLKTSMGLRISPYLRDAADKTNTTQDQILVAVDLEGIASPGEIFQALDDVKALEGHANDFDQLADTLAGVKGVTFRVSITDKAAGTMHIDFNSSVEFMKPYAKELVAEVFKGAGLAMSEFDKWDMTVKGNQLSFTGPLTDSGLRRLGSLILVPNVDMTKGEETQGDGDTPMTKDDMATRSKAYYDAVQGYLADVHRAAQADRLSDTAIWVERYARRIDGLPILGVDEELQDWGLFTAARMRDLTQRLNQVNTKSATRMSKHSNFYDTEDSGGAPTKQVWVRSSGRSYNRGYWGNSSYHSGRDYRSEEYEYAVERYRRKYQEGKRQEVRMQERASGIEETQAIIKELDNEAARMRRTMTERYQTEF